MARLSPGGVLVLVILFFIFVNPSAQPASIAQIEAVREAVRKEQADFSILNSSLPADFSPNDPDRPRWLNLTGLREGDGYKWELLPRVQERARIQLAEAAGEHGLDIINGTPNSSLPVYHNVSGWIKGEWVRSKVGEDLSTPKVNLTAVAPDVMYYSSTYGRNITGEEGRVHMRLSEKQKAGVQISDGVIQGLTARITLQDETSYADGWTTALHGVHNRESGSMLLTTTSEKFSGIFALPHFSLSPDFFDLAKHFLNVSLAETIIRQEDDPNNASENPWTSVTLDDETPSSPMCELVVYLQQHAVPSSSVSVKDQSPEGTLALIGDIEQELRFPTGRPIPQSPQIRISMLVFSPDCGFILESKGLPDYPDQAVNHLEGPKVEIYVAKAKRIMLFFMLIVTGQLFLLVNQMKASVTPSARSRISFYTLTMMSLGTGFAAFSFLFLSSFLISMYLTAMTVAFLLFLEGNFFGMKFMMDVWMAQEPERTERQRRRQQRAAAAIIANTSTTPAAPSVSTVTVPQVAVPPVDASTTSPPLPINPPPLLGNTTSPPPDATLPTINTPMPAVSFFQAMPFTQGTPFTQAIPPPAATTPTPATPSRPTTFGAIYTRYCLLLLSLIFISIHAATSWPTSVRTIYANTLSFLYLSFWLPQIYRNILRNCRKPFEFRFVLGQSVLRLAPFAYLWAVEGNVLFVDPDVKMFVGFVVWMALQVAVLLGQEVLGPRWCVSERWGWVPVAWDYHPILKEDEESATMPIGVSANPLLDDVEAGSASSPASPLLSSTTTHPSSHGSLPTRSFDCAICMQRRQVHVIPPSSSLNSGLFGESNADRNASTTSSAHGLSTTTAGFGNRLMLERKRREYMVTPCRHIFDTKCLEGWMGYRLQCPTCRETLPPL